MPVLTQDYQQKDDTIHWTYEFMLFVYLRPYLLIYILIYLNNYLCLLTV